MLFKSFFAFTQLFSDSFLSRPPCHSPGMTTIDDIAGAVLGILSGSTAFAAAVPGQAWFERAPDSPAAYPYAVFHIAAEPAEFSFESAYTQVFTLTIAAYAPQGGEASPGDPPGVQQALFNSLASNSANEAFQAFPLRNSSELILHAIPVAPTGGYSKQLRDGRDVFACGLAVQLLVQGDRSAA